VIARSLAIEPTLMVCDDTLSSLDAQAREQVVAAFERRKLERGTAYLHLSNDLDVVRRLARRMLVLYAGHVIERGATQEVLAAPLHPFTRMLVSAAPDPARNRRHLTVVVEGTTPSPSDLPSGCAFHPRCPRAETGRCDVETPSLEIPQGGSHAVACFHPLI
jgi:oligopeptide/dipeptide ABC transporter ATP-binding protein